jgi:hypothetical protein
MKDFVALHTALYAPIPAAPMDCLDLVYVALGRINIQTRDHDEMFISQYSARSEDVLRFAASCRYFVCGTAALKLRTSVKKNNANLP